MKLTWLAALLALGCLHSATSQKLVIGSSSSLALTGRLFQQLRLRFFVGAAYIYDLVP
jgi:hypothetical protein